jgi:hypothetical protein
MDVILANDPSVSQPGRCEDRCVTGGGRLVEWPAVRREKAMRHLMLSEPWERGPPRSPAPRATLLRLNAWWVATEEPPAVDPDEGCLTGDSAGTDRGSVCSVDAELQVGHDLSDLYTPFAGREAGVVDPEGLVPQHVLQGIECVSACALAARRERARPAPRRRRRTPAARVASAGNASAGYETANSYSSSSGRET